MLKSTTPSKSVFEMDFQEPEFGVTRVGDQSDQSVPKLPHIYSAAFCKTYHYSI
jgi:hypothetical protein